MVGVNMPIGVTKYQMSVISSLVTVALEPPAVSDHSLLTYNIL